MVVREAIDLLASGLSPGATVRAKRRSELTEGLPHTKKGKRNSAAGTQRNEALPQASESVQQASESLGKRSSRARRPPEVYNDQDYNKKGPKPTPSSLAEDSEATNPSTVEEQVNEEAQEKGKPGRTPGKQGGRSRLQQVSQLESEAKLTSSDIETETSELPKPAAKRNGKGNGKAAKQPSRPGRKKKQKTVSSQEDGEDLPAVFQINANANGYTDSATSPVVSGAETAVLPPAEPAAVAREEEILAEPEQPAGRDLSSGVHPEREAVHDSRGHAFAHQTLESAFRNSGPMIMRHANPVITTGFAQGSIQEDNVSINAVHPQKANFASLASVASGNEVFVAREAAKVNSPAALESDIAAAEGDPKSIFPLESSASIAAALAAAEADNANVSHPSTPSPTEETAMEQDPAESLPPSLEEAAATVQEAVREAAQTAQEVTQEVQAAVQQAVVEPAINLLAELKALEAQPLGPDPDNLLEAGTDILSNGQPVAEEAGPAAVLSEADKALRTPEGMLAEAADLLQDPGDTLESDSSEQAVDAVDRQLATHREQETNFDPEVEETLRKAKQLAASMRLLAASADNTAAAPGEAVALLARSGQEHAGAATEGRQPEAAEETAAALEVMLRSSPAPESLPDTQRKAAAAGASSVSHIHLMEAVPHAPTLVGDNATQIGAGPAEAPNSLALALASMQPTSSASLTASAPKEWRKRAFLPVKPYQLKRLASLKSGRNTLYKAGKLMGLKRQLVLDHVRAEYESKCDEHQKISAQLEEQYAQKVSAASNEAVVRNEVVTRKQERRKNRLTALNSVRSILEEEDDDMLLLEQMEADKSKEEEAKMQQHGLRLLNQGAQQTSTMNSRLNSTRPPLCEFGSVLPETPSASEDSLMTARIDCDGDATYSGATRLTSAALKEINWPAIWSHPAAWQAFQSVVKDHTNRTKTAWKYSMRPALGRDLAGYAARCGDIADSDSKIGFGCGTSLADVHYHCAHCVEAAGEAEEDFAEEGSLAEGAVGVVVEKERQARDPGLSQEEASATSNDYCEKCMRESKGACPNPNCLSKGTNDSQLVPMDFLRVPHVSSSKSFCSKSKALNDHCQDLAELVTRHNHKILKRAKRGLCSKCFVINGGRCPMYEANVEVATQHLLFRNGLDEGVPVLIKECGHHFNPEPFSAEGMQELAMEDLAEKSMEERWKVKAQFDGHGGETVKTDDLSVTDFFKPMLRGAEITKNLADPEIAVEGSSSSLSGFKLPDFGNLPQKQCTAFFKGLDKLGIGETARLNGTQNLAFYLRAEERDPANGTRRPDLGPKFYIARPKLVGKKQRRYEGRTFTPLHCDLADAVNFSCSGEEATWHMFHRNDRAKLMKFLQKHYGSEETQGVDLLWNPTNHRVLDEQDFKVLREVYAVHPWEFIQRAGEVVVIPAGCAHQVVNGGKGHNIKVAQDFVAPESAAISLELLDEMRRAKQEDKVQAVLTLRFAGADGHQQILEALKARGLALPEEDSPSDA